MTDDATDADSIRQAMRTYIEQVLMERVSSDAERRAEALRDYLTISRAAGDEKTADCLAAAIPPVLPALYRKWARMFVARLFETVPEQQVALLCDGGDDGKAALILAYLMFLESERMERQMAEDLRCLGESQSMAATGPEPADVAAGFIRARIATLAEEMKKTN